MYQPCMSCSGGASSVKSPSPKDEAAIEPGASPSSCQRTVIVAGPTFSGSTRKPEPAPLTPPADGRMPNGGPLGEPAGCTAERYAIVTGASTSRVARQWRKYGKPP